jgi:hypothetical protein
LNALAEAFGIPERAAVPLLAGEGIRTETIPAEDSLASLVRGAISSVAVEQTGRLSTTAARPGGLLPGAFNPVHEGHWKLAAVASRLLGFPVAFELSVHNVDKPPLGESEARRRAGQFAWKGDLWLTRAPTFLEKAGLFPGAVFVVGADTASRIVEPRYYGGNEERMLAALDRIRSLGGRFLVAGREDGGRRFVSGEELTLPASHRDLFTAIPPALFRLAMSSTELRRRDAGHVPVASAANDG